MTYAVTVTSTAFVSFLEFSSCIFWELSSLLHCKFVERTVTPENMMALTRSLDSLLLLSWDWEWSAEAKERRV